MALRGGRGELILDSCFLASVGHGANRDFVLCRFVSVKWGTRPMGCSSNCAFLSPFINTVKLAMHLHSVVICLACTTCDCPELTDSDIK